MRRARACVAVTAIADRRAFANATRGGRAQTAPCVRVLSERRGQTMWRVFWESTAVTISLSVRIGESVNVRRDSVLAKRDDSKVQRAREERVLRIATSAEGASR